MILWLLLTLDFIIQDPVTTSILLADAYQRGYNPWVMHGLFLAAVVFDVYIGYWLGQFAKERFADWRISRWLTKQAKRFDRLAGRSGKRAAMLLWGPVIFPYSAVLAPWFGFTRTETLVLSLIGDTLLWYGPLWLIVLEVQSIVVNSLTALFVIAGVSLLVVLLLRYIYRHSTLGKLLTRKTKRK